MYFLDIGIKDQANLRKDNQMIKIKEHSLWAFKYRRNKSLVHETSPPIGSFFCSPLPIDPTPPKT